VILTDNEMRQVRSVIEDQAGLDPELAQRCRQLLHLGAFDEAVRSAFVLLEERLRAATDKEGMTGVQLVNYAFSPNKGPLTQQMGRTQNEKDGLRELYAGAFRLFRNPTAHGVVDYSAAEGRAIIGLVDLLLRMLKRAEELPPVDLFPDNVETALEKAEKLIGAGGASRVRVFLAKACTDLHLQPSKGAKTWIPFRTYCLYKAEGWQEPRAHRIAVFYFIVTERQCSISFPTDYYYKNVVDFDVASLTKETIELGFVLQGKNQEPAIDLKVCNDQAFLDRLLDLVARTVGELEATLQNQ